jgi:hypothetical protein
MAVRVTAASFAAALVTLCLVWSLPNAATPATKVQVTTLTPSGGGTTATCGALSKTQASGYVAFTGTPSGAPEQTVPFGQVVTVGPC